MKQLKLINPENVEEKETHSYLLREAARAVVFDSDNKVALLHSTKNQYYKLPGGGIEEGESPEAALLRECREEIGCEVEITGELGIIVEYRKRDKLKQISYCYMAKVKGEKGISELTKAEIREGFETAWMSLVEAANVTKVVGVSAVYQAQYVVTRDSTFLEEALKIYKD